MPKTVPNELLHLLWVEELANPAAPDLAELTDPSVLDLIGDAANGGDMETITGMSTTGSTSPTPSLGSNLVTKAASVEELGDPQLTWWWDDDPTSNAAAIFDAIETYDSGYLVRAFPVNGARQAIEESAVVEVWPARVTKRPQRNDTVSGEAIRFSATFALTGKPILAATVTDLEG